MSATTPNGPPSEPVMARSSSFPPPLKAAPQAVEASQPTAVVLAPAAGHAESELWNLIERVERLAPALSSEALSAASSRLEALANASGTQEENWLAPRTLTFGVCQRCEAEQHGGCSAADVADSSRPHSSAVGGVESSGGVGEHEWQGPFFDDHFDGLWAYQGGVLSDFGEAPRTYSAQGRDLLGLRNAARRLTCDYHDRRCGGPNACMANQVLQQRAVAKLIEKLQRQRQRPSMQYGDGGSMRFLCYRAIIADRIADPLGPGNRVRLPECLMVAVRKLFPNPVCDVECGCDFSDVCLRERHYTGFRSTEESRIVCEGG